MMISADTPHTYSYIPDIGKALVMVKMMQRQVQPGTCPETVTTANFCGWCMKKPVNH
ncbi:MAG: hypothetical protein U0401_31455 [Anaerolineae bacterium]